MPTPRPTAPCKDCKERREGCHSACEKYKSYKAQWDKYQDVVQKNNNERIFTSTVRSHNVQKKIDDAKRRNK